MTYRQIITFSLQPLARRWNRYWLRKAIERAERDLELTRKEAEEKRWTANHLQWLLITLRQELRDL